MQGVLGASKNGEDVYVAARGAFPNTGASGEGKLPVEKAGVVNLYLLAHGSAPVFIATLAESDGSEVQPFSWIPPLEPNEGFFMVIGSLVWVIVLLLCLVVVWCLCPGSVCRLLVFRRVIRVVVRMRCMSYAA